MRVVEFNDIHRAYRRNADVLSGVSFSLGTGEVVGLLGRNGAGKTTLMRIAIGMLEAQSGSVRMFGLDPREAPLQVRQRIGFVSEDQVLPPFLTVSQVIDLHRGLFETWDDDLVRRLGERFALPPGMRIKELSKGQARQVALLCAMAHRPEVLLLDEPAGGLDPAARREFLETSIQYLNEAGATILFSSHYMGDVERMAGRIVMLHDGRVLLNNGLDQLQEEFSIVLVPRSPRVSRDALLRLEGCLGVRERSDALHAVFRLDAERSGAELKRRLGIDGARSRAVALEEMFVELVGGQS
jgi:ABC-2 type transport system ATP-binding protein